VAADPDAHAELGGAALHHAPGVDAVHGRGGQRAGAADGGAEEGGLAALANAGRLDIGVEIGFQSVMCRAVSNCWNLNLLVFNKLGRFIIALKARNCT
jgi:hypothetical protein